MNKTKALLFATVILMDVLVGMEFDLFVPSFPEIQSYFQLTPFWVEAMLSVNFIGFCVSLFFVGDMADRFGRKPVILGGLFAFVVGSILCLWAPYFSYLLLGRFLQGVGIAAPSILSFLLVADAFDVKKQQVYMAMLNGLMNISFACAPVLGSYATLYFHWRANFAILLFLGVVALAMSLFLVPKHTEARAKEDVVGYLGIFQTKPLMQLITFFIFMLVPWWVFAGISSLLYLEDLGVSLSHFGYYQGGLALAFAAGSLLYGLFVNRWDQKKLLYGSNALFAICLLLVAYTTYIDCTSALVITLSILLFVIASIVPATILFPIALNFLPQAKGRAAALIQGGRLIFSSLCLQLAGYFYTGSFQNIGLILIPFILLTIVMLHAVLQKQPQLLVGAHNGS